MEKINHKIEFDFCIQDKISSLHRILPIMGMESPKGSMGHDSILLLEKNVHISLILYYVIHIYMSGSHYDCG